MEWLATMSTTAAGKSFWEWVAFILQNYWQFFLIGAGYTLLIALVGTIVGFVIGLGVGVVRTIPVDAKSPLIKRIILKIVNAILAIYIEVFRGTPMMVQAAVIYFGYAMFNNQQGMDPILAGFIIVSINTGAYLSEVVRGGILSVDKGQFEAAHSIGMTHTKTMLNIVLPQAIRTILPALGNEFIINIKDTSVLNVISVTELFFMSATAAGTYMQFFPVYLIACVIYLIMTFSISRILRLVERKMEGPKTFTIHGSQTVPEAEIKVHLNGNGGGDKGQGSLKRWFGRREKGNW